MKNEKLLQKYKAEFIEHCNSIMHQKAKEYSPDTKRDDGLEEFYWVAERLGCSATAHCNHLLHKHLFCISKIENGEYENVTKDFLLEKYGDAYNYYTLAIMINDKDMSEIPNTTVDLVKQIQKNLLGNYLFKETQKYLLDKYLLQLEIILKNEEK